MKQLFASLLFIAGAAFAMEESKPTYQMIQLLSEKSIETIDWLFQENILNLTKQDPDGNTMLHNLAEIGEPILFRKLGNKITTDAKNIINNTGKKPADIITENILKSSEKSENNQLEQLLRCKEILNLNIGKFFDKVDTPFIGNVKSLEEALKKNRINFDIYDDNGDTYFHKICASSSVDLIKVFLKHLPRNVYGKKNRYNLTPYQVLEQRKHFLSNYHEEDQKESIELQELLVAYKKQQLKKEKEPILDFSSCNEQFIKDEELVRKALENGTLSLSTQNEEGNTLLHIWAENGCWQQILHFECIGYSTTNKKNKNGLTPKQVAQLKYRQLAQNGAREETLKKYQYTIDHLGRCGDDCTII